MDSPRNPPPVAVRVVRPYDTVEDLLAVESNGFTRTGVVLVGAPSRPQGVVLRFEICLRDGTAIMRGEGRVVGHRPQSSSDEGALMLRFTRLDVKSKELLDKAVALREERRSLIPAAPPKMPSAKPPPAPVPEVALAPAAPPAPEVTEVEETEVDDADIQSADPNDLTEQAPPVAMLEAISGPKEKGPIPTPSPGNVPVTHPQPVHEPPPHREQHEAPPHREQHEHMPAPTKSPNRPGRAKGEEFRMSIEPAQRDSALEALRARAKRLGVT
jgi:hypothetical protein